MTQDDYLKKLLKYEQAECEGRLQIIDKELFCRRAAKLNGKCAGYTENMFTHRSLKMCEMCIEFDPTADDDVMTEDDFNAAMEMAEKQVENLND